MRDRYTILFIIPSCDSLNYILDHPQLHVLIHQYTNDYNEPVHTISELILGHWQPAIHVFATLMLLILGYFTDMSVLNDLPVQVSRYNRAIDLHAVFVHMS